MADGKFDTVLGSDKVGIAKASPEQPLQAMPSRVRAVVSAKLGRCARCMRAASGGSLVGWVLVAVVYLLWPHPLVLGVALLVAVCFTLLMLAHIATFTFRVAGILIGGRQAKLVGDSSSGVTTIGRRELFGTVLRAGFAGVVVSTLGPVALGRIGVAEAAAICCLCECYPSRTNYCLDKPGTFCGALNQCITWNDSTRTSLKLKDGLCIEKEQGSRWDHPVLLNDPGLVAQAFGLYTEAYIRAGLDGGPKPDGSPGGAGPDPQLISQADAMLPNEPWRRDTRNAVHATLHYILGWDFLSPSLVQVRSRYPYGQMPHLSGSPRAVIRLRLVRAAQEGVVKALRENNPEAVDGPIMRFWRDSEHADFEPLHQGPCYHQHPDELEPFTPEQCQLASLKRMLEVVLDGRPRAQSRRTG